MAETFITSDTHLDHYNVALHSGRDQFISVNPDFDPSKPKSKANRPRLVDLEAHNEHIIKTWNATVGKKDETWFLGDFAWKRHAHFLQRLNGKKYLIRGNHDKMPQDALRLFADIEGAKYQYSFFTKINRKQVMLSHCAYDSWFSSCHGSWNLHGHSHGRRPEQPHVLQFDVGWDVWGQPIPWNVIEAKMADKEIARSQFYSNDDRIEGDEAEKNVEIARKLNMKYLK